MSASSSSPVFLLLRCPPAQLTKQSPRQGSPWLVPSSPEPLVIHALEPALALPAGIMSLPWTFPQGDSPGVSLHPAGGERWVGTGWATLSALLEADPARRGVMTVPGSGHSSHKQQSWSGKPNRPARERSSQETVWDVTSLSHPRHEKRETFCHEV